MIFKNILFLTKKILSEKIFFDKIINYSIDYGQSMFQREKYFLLIAETWSIMIIYKIGWFYREGITNYNDLLCKFYLNNELHKSMTLNLQQHIYNPQHEPTTLPSYFCLCGRWKLLEWLSKS